jgi:hypothetical protein
MASLYITNHPPPESDPSRTHPQSSQPSSKEYKPSFLERRGLKSPPTPPPYRTPEEEKAEALRLKKIERAKKKEAEEKARLKREKQVAISKYVTSYSVVVSGRKSSADTLL